MPRNGQQIYAQLLDADRNLAHGLRGIRMHQCATPFCFASNLRYRLNCSDFILRMNDRDDGGLLVDCGRDIVRRHDAVGLRWNTPDRAT